MVCLCWPGQSSADPSPLMPPPPPPPSPLVVVPDTAYTRYPVSPTFPPNYESLAEGELALDLADPSNVRTEAEYDPATGCYIIRTKVGDYEVATPFILTAEQYNNMEMRRSMLAYFNRRKPSLSKARRTKNRLMFLT